LGGGRQLFLGQVVDEIIALHASMGAHLCQKGKN
jgi:hypothetical protein